MSRVWGFVNSGIVFGVVRDFKCNGFKLIFFDLGVRR